jgi:hypothetical protein
MTGTFRTVRREKGEGFLPNLLLLLALGALGYGAYYFYNKSSKPAPAAATPGAIERTTNDARPGSPAGAAVQQAQEMGSTAAQ